MSYFIALLAFLAQSAPSVAASSPAPLAFGFFVNNTIQQPAGNGSFFYPRYTEVQDGTILATATLTGYNPSFFPVFESKDGGATWEWISNVTDTQNGWGLPAQPMLTVLSEPLGAFDAGTILASGNSWSDTGTRIDLYASADRARSWKFVSRVAEGGPPNTTNGYTPVWEPYLLEYNKSLICYYSDQRDPKHGQKLSYQVSTDLKAWGPVVNTVAYDAYESRPGMPVVIWIPPIQKWIIVYEYPGGNASYGSNYPVYYRLADSPLEFQSSNGVVIVTDNKKTPNASPYVAWSSIGGPNGTIIVSDADHSQIFTNQFGGDKDEWEEHGTVAPITYSRPVHILSQYPDHLLIYGAGTYDDFSTNFSALLTATVLNLTEVLVN
ncbi:Oligoxyloglucan reducing end-specific cellobiohydrolase [Colletotrichum somersetense]|nr:Oligoxyloglucan reducing end-specific cellobiohydrolase [Colletotrichum somersetense]